MAIKINENLRILRTKERYSLEDVAEIIGVSRQSVAKWENGESMPDIEKCMKLAKLYKVSLDDLVSEEFSIEKMDDDEEHGKYFFGVVKLEDGKVIVPEKAKTVFKLEEGDALMFLGDKKKGMALVKVGKLF